MFLHPPEPRLNLVLVRPQIPPNTGNVARLCAVTGTPLHLVAPLGFALTEKKLRRAGLDYWNKVHAATHASFEELVREGGLTSDNVHLFTSRATRGLWETRFRPGDWLILGEEQEGLPAEALERSAIPRAFEARDEIRGADLLQIVERQGLRTIHEPGHLQLEGGRIDVGMAVVLGRRELVLLV